MATSRSSTAASSTRPSSARSTATTGRPSEPVTPAKAGVQCLSKALDSGFRRNDGFFRVSLAVAARRQLVGSVLHALPGGARGVLGPFPVQPRLALGFVPGRLQLALGLVE